MTQTSIIDVLERSMWFRTENLPDVVLALARSHDSSARVFKMPTQTGKPPRHFQVLVMEDMVEDMKKHLLEHQCPCGMSVGHSLSKHVEVYAHDHRVHRR